MYISIIISPRCEGMKSSAAPAKNDYRLVRLLLTNVKNDIVLKFVSWPLKVNIGSKNMGEQYADFPFIAVSVTMYTRPCAPIEAGGHNPSLLGQRGIGDNLGIIHISHIALITPLH